MREKEKSMEEVGCIRCEYPSEPCRGSECDHFYPRKEWLEFVEKEMKLQCEEESQ